MFNSQVVVFYKIKVTKRGVKSDKKTNKNELKIFCSIQALQHASNVHNYFLVYCIRYLYDWILHIFLLTYWRQKLLRVEVFVHSQHQTFSSVTKRGVMLPSVSVIALESPYLWLGEKEKCNKKCSTNGIKLYFVGKNFFFEIILTTNARF